MPIPLIADELSEIIMIQSDCSFDRLDISSEVPQRPQIGHLELFLAVFENRRVSGGQDRIDQ